MDEYFDSNEELIEYESGDNEFDYIPELTPIQEKQIEELPDILDKIDALLKILDIPKDIEPDTSHMEPFIVEDNISYLYENIIQECSDTGIMNAACSADLLYFLHPEHSPPF